jgi:hyperosmotically inducible periplasmic protein
MNAKTILKLACCILVASQCISAGAQPSDASAAAPTTSSATPTNRQLAKKVRTALSKTKGIDITSIAIRAKGGSIALSGSVPDATQIDKAGQVAQGVEGVTSVKNDLTVREVGQ